MSRDEKLRIKLLGGEAAFRAFCVGFEFQTNGRHWRKRGNPVCRGSIRTKKPKRLNEVGIDMGRTVYATYPTLAGERDKVRSLEKHRKLVDKMAAKLDPDYKAKPWDSDRRNTTQGGSEGLEMITQAFERHYC